MKKRIVSMMLAAMVALSVAGCGSKTLSNDYVTVKQYKGLEVAQVEKVEVTDEQVEQSVQANLNAAAEKEPIKDRAAEKGDWVNIDYTGYIDDVAFEGGTATGSDLELGSGSFIGAEGGYAGFEDQIIGHSTGEEFDIEVKFSDSYPGTDVAGKVARFHIVLNEIYKQNIPELTDEWVASNSKTAKTADEYRKEVRKQIESSAETANETTLKSEIQEALLEEIDKVMGEPVHELVDLLRAVGLQKIAEGGHLIAVHRKFFRAGEKNDGAVVMKGTQPAGHFDPEQSSHINIKKDRVEPEAVFHVAD